MKNVLLVNTNTEKNPYPVPPLGLCILAGILKKTYNVHVYDGMFDNGNNLAGVIEKYNPDYVGVSIRNIDNMDVINPANYMIPVLESFIKPIRRATEAPLILGGSAFSIFPRHFMNLYQADYGIIGEAENAFPQLLKCLEQGGNPGEIPFVWVKNAVALNTQASSVELNANPYSDIDLCIDYAPYRARSSYPVQTKRGCAHQCIYCTYNCIEGTTYRTRSPELIAEEIRLATERLGTGSFEFVDSTFNDPPGHAEAICREIIRTGINVRLRTMGINPCNASRELFGLMRGAGFSQIDCTPDTASPSMLVSLGKNFTREDLENTALIIRETAMPTMWFFIFGGPGETDATIRESFDFIDSCIGKMDMVHMTCGMRIYPGTGLHRLAIEHGMIDRDDDLTETRFYFSPGIGRDRLFAMINEASRTRPNCVPVMESTPSAEMMREAMRLREEERLDEPMFRTLLRIRYRMFGKEMA